MKCLGTKKDGTPCGANASPEEPYCAHHRLDDVSHTIPRLSVETDRLRAQIAAYKMAALRKAPTPESVAFLKKLATDTGKELKTALLRAENAERELVALREAWTEAKEDAATYLRRALNAERELAALREAAAKAVEKFEEFGGVFEDCVNDRNIMDEIRAALAAAPAEEEKP